ncbi:hypothetical protein LguiB_000846 [Lonicera macranthoides]
MRRMEIPQRRFRDYLLKTLGLSSQTQVCNNLELISREAESTITFLEAFALHLTIEFNWKTNADSFNINQFQGNDERREQCLNPQLPKWEVIPEVIALKPVGFLLFF